MQITKKVPNLLTTVPNICYNELVEVRVAILGSGCVDCSNNQHSFFICLYAVKGNTPFNNIPSHIIPQYIAFVKRHDTIFCVFLIFNPFKFWYLMGKIAPVKPFIAMKSADNYPMRNTLILSKPFNIS